MGLQRFTITAWPCAHDGPTGGRGHSLLGGMRKEEERKQQCNRPPNIMYYKSVSLFAQNCVTQCHSVLSFNN